MREYNTRNTYVTNAVVDGNVIRLKRLKRVSGAWKKASDDSIMNQKNTAAQAIKLTTRITDKALTEKYIFPASRLCDAVSSKNSRNKECNDHRRYYFSS